MTTPLTVEQRPLTQLTTDPDNARARGPRAIEAIARSLEAFGQQKPIVVTPDGVVIAGNGTLEAAKQLGWDTVTCHVTALNPAEARAYSIADNRTAELAYWNDAQLLGALQAAQESDLLDATAFDNGELERLTKLLSKDGIDEDSELGSYIRPRRTEEEYKEAGVRMMVLPYLDQVYELVADAMNEKRKELKVATNSDVILKLLDIQVEEA
ncbi:ParB/Srx family N-terminal domain-containing protein [bacterium]|nr:ParB/Srx family N-terminal domain-containing protein [bacterium]